MSISFFKKSNSKKEEKVSYYVDFENGEREEYEDNLKFFRDYKNDLIEKFSIEDIDAFLLITQALLFYYPFDVSEVRNLEKNLSQDNYRSYVKEKVNLDKIHRFFMFFATTRTHELKSKYEEWMREYYDKYKKPIFMRGERNRYVVDGKFTDFVHEKILECQKY